MLSLQVFVVVVVLVASSCVVDARRPRPNFSPRRPKPNFSPRRKPTILPRPEPMPEPIMPGGRKMCRVTNICMNGGICRTIGTGWRCECRNGWTGSRCRSKLDEFCPKNNACMNGGKCVNSEIHGLNWRCICPTGFSGTRCEDRTTGASRPGQKPVSIPPSKIPPSKIPPSDPPSNSESESECADEW